LKYRAEIDGLRALAVMPVILFHAGFEFFSGGFVGVDVFFVISGYLITTILIEDIEKKQFSILNFYERRARRILPALFFVLLICIPFAWMWMLPSQMKDFSQSLVAVSLFASNILFWRESGYFDAAAEEKPLLHTWSLAVEEQYYVLFPIFLILAWRFGKNRVFWMIVVMAAISLLLSEWGWRNKPNANFFLAPTRAWELFAGSIAAFVVQKRGVQKNDALSLLGLSGIVFSIFAYDESTPFPSVYALVPVLGVVLLILYADKDTLAAKLLSTKAFVGIGLISYSAYLWHQPLFAFARIRQVEHPSPTLMLTLSLASIAFAFVSWMYVEKPFRYSLKSRKLIFLASFIALAIPFSIGLFWLSEISKEASSGSKLTGINCKFFQGVGDASCINSNHKNANLTVLIWGDSHSLALRKDVIVPKDVNVISIGHSGCAPLIGLYRFDGIGNSTNCNNKEVILNYANYINDINPDIVVLVARWPLYLNGWERKGVRQSAHHMLTNSDENMSLVLNSDSFRKELVLSKLKDTVDYLSAKKVYVLVSPPDLADVGLTRFNLWKEVIPYSEIKSYNAAVKDIIDEKDAFDVIDSKELFCADGVCRLTTKGLPLYDDDNHVSFLGSRIIWENILVGEIFEYDEINK
jgi:peptidoglycan/LPS O-acetylase OafA/YrhL